MISLLSKLIALPSPSREENGAASFLEQELRLRGADVHRRGNNLWCAFGSGPAVLMDAHIDTVRPVDGWTRDPFKPSLEGSRLYGLGSNDDGGPAVALIDAWFRLREKDQACCFVLSLSAEEEISGKDGLEAVLPEIEAAAGPIACGVFAEPTSLQMVLAEKGLMVLDCSVKGVAAHAARGGGDNAIYKAIPAMEWFRCKGFPLVSALLGPVSMQVTQVQAGTQHNVVPDLCSFVVDVRSNGLYSNAALLEMIKADAPCSVAARSTRLEGSAIREDHPLVLRGKELGLAAAGSPTLSNMALCRFPAIKLGPGDSERSHTADEWVDVTELGRASDIYFKLLDGFTI